MYEHRILPLIWDSTGNLQLSKTIFILLGENQRVLLKRTYPKTIRGEQDKYGILEMLHFCISSCQSLGEKMELSECSFTAGVIFSPVFLNGEKSSPAHVRIKEVYKGAIISFHTERNLSYIFHRKIHIFHKKMKSSIPGFGGVT